MNRPFVLSALAAFAAFTVQAEPNAKIDQMAKEGYWLQGKASQEKAMAMLNRPAPGLSLAEWHGQQPATTGKIVLVDFWATWCGPCIAQIPHANAMAKKYADKGVVIYGACCARGAETMSKVAADKGMEYPTGKLNDDTTKAWNIAFWPTYAVIDRTGKVRALGLEPEKVEPVLEALLAEQPK